MFRINTILRTFPDDKVLFFITQTQKASLHGNVSTSTRVPKSLETHIYGRSYKDGEYPIHIDEFKKYNYNDFVSILIHQNKPVVVKEQPQGVHASPNAKILDVYATCLKNIYVLAKKGRLQVFKQAVLDVIRNRISVPYNYRIKLQDAFFACLMYEETQLAKFLLDVYLCKSVNMGEIDIHVDNEYILRYCCKYGLTYSVQFLLELPESVYGILNIHANNDEAIQSAQMYEHTEIYTMLLSVQKRRNGTS